MSPGALRSELASRRGTLGVLLVLVAAANAPSLRWPFLTDDWALLGTFIRPGGFRFWITPIRTPLYRPVSWGGVALQHSLFGLHPLPYHLVALAFVLGASATLFAVALQLGLRPASALITGLVFGVHPAMAWGVGWMCCVGTPMGEFFASLALLRLLRPTPGRRDHLLGLLFLLLAIGSHETFAVFPAMLILLRFGTSTVTGVAARARAAVVPALPTLVTAAAIVITQSLEKVAVPASSSYYSSVFSTRMLGNMGRLLEDLSGFVLARPGHLGDARAYAVTAITWSLLIAGAVVAHRSGRSTALWGLLAVVPCVVPSSVLVNQTMNPYYLEVALLPLALAVGSIAETLLAAQPVRVQLRAALPVGVALACAGGVVMTSYWSGSFLQVARDRQRALIAEAQAIYGDRRPASISLPGTGSLDSQVTYRGTTFRVLYDEPDLAVHFGS